MMKTQGRSNPVLTSPRARVYLAAAGVTVTGVILAALLSQHGIGISPDSTIYLKAARNFAAGTGYHIDGLPFMSFPPGYPLFLAACALPGADMLFVIRLMHLAILGCNLMLSMWIVSAVTRGSVAAAISAGLLLLSSASILFTHVMAWSEPLFITTVLLSLLMLIYYSRRQSRFILVMLIITIAYGVMTRYIGITLLPPVIAVLLTLHGKSLGWRIRRSIAVSVLSTLPLGSWFLYNASLNLPFAGRVFGIHRPHMVQISAFLFTPGLDVLPWNETALPGACLVVLLTTFLLSLTWKGMRHADTRTRGVADGYALPAVFAIVFTLAYFAFVFVSIIAFGNQIYFDSRFFSPIAVIGTIFLCTALYHTLARKGSVLLSWLTLLLFIALAGNRILAMQGRLEEAMMDGLGYASRSWRESPTVRFAATLPSNRIVHANGADALSFLTSRQVRVLPFRFDPASGKPFPGYDEKMRSITRDVLQSNAFVVYLDRTTWLWFLPSRNELEQTCHLPVLVRFPDGIVFGIEANIGQETEAAQR